MISVVRMRGGGGSSQQLRPRATRSPLFVLGGMTEETGRDERGEGRRRGRRRAVSTGVEEEEAN